MVTNIDMAARRISLSIKSKEVSEEKSAMAQFGSSDSGASLGDILGAAIREKQQETQEMIGDGNSGEEAIAHEAAAEPEASEEAPGEDDADKS